MEHFQEPYNDGNRDGDESPDASLSLGGVPSAEVALKILEESKFLQQLDQFVILTDLTFGLCNSLWNILDHEYPDIRKTASPEDGILELRMPSWTHDSVVTWLAKCVIDWALRGQLTPNEVEDLWILSSPVVNLPNPVPNPPRAPRRNLKKEPDTGLISYRAPSSGFDSQGKKLSPVPSILFEAGFSQSYESLKENARRVLLGGAPTVRLVVLVKHFKQAHKRVKTKIEFWRLNRQGVAQKDEERYIFPVPNVPQLPLCVTREDVFGSAFILDGQNPHDLLEFNLNKFRVVAARTLDHQGLRPM
ncbi:hypothetical protein N7495_000919 [Penicillium taxi]|uniref:uncharacterized protein n=1 Tax=Penicillium taxi TaxID=168475 RepID=UPI00254528E7|nr:uncharacterized protein N7495_000919 [Penicillium taxi]KAJ5908237.1 hypothetical protein N7495_000919 [Penicillium taxi]